jgi:hypothetical protein
MISWLKLSVAFFVLTLCLTFLAYYFGPADIKEAFRAKESPVGQLSTSGTTQSVGQPAKSK